MDIPTHKWTMVIDLDKCTGCSSCVVGCHAENNVPMVSEQEVVRGRGQHWMRIERYWEGTYPNIQARFLPVLCQQCDRAPCEPVCPVYATLHSDRENVNLQVYNRCVGTRYCQNNDPYKARFFNFFAPVFDEPLNQQLNPDVTVRSVGIMEKCTFCIQRIRRAEEQALVENRSLRDGEVAPACVQACPPGALIFGDLRDPQSQVARLATDQRAFRLLEHVGTEPAIYYLKGGASNVNS
jgi:Fe-S-cluster-containing dehydrogenase component